jgi:hypothetical protein
LILSALEDWRKEPPALAGDLEAALTGSNQNAKHSNMLPMSPLPSRGGAGGPVSAPPAASLFGPPGVDSSNSGFTEASVGRPKTASISFRIDVRS